MHSLPNNVKNNQLQRDRSGEEQSRYYYAHTKEGGDTI